MYANNFDSYGLQNTCDSIKCNLKKFNYFECLGKYVVEPSSN